MATAAAEPPVKPAEQVKKTPPNPDAARKFAERLGITTDPKKPDEAKLKPEPKPKAEKPKPVAAPPAPAPLTASEISSAVAEGVTRATQKPDKTEETKEQAVEFPPAEAKRLAVLERMEKSNPEKYKGKAKAYRDSYTKLVEYAEKWQAENPGKDFVEDDEEHKEFFEKNNVDWDDEDFTEALADMKADERVSASRKEIDQKFSKLERAEKLQSEAPKIVAEQTTCALSFFGALDGDFTKLLKQDGQFDKELYTKLEASDPITARIIVTNAANLEDYVADTYKLFSNLADFDTKNPNHVTINQFIIAKETQLLQKPKEKQLDEKGRQFLPAEKYHALNDAEKSKHWTFVRDDIEALLTAAIIAQTKDQIKAEEEKFQRIAKARGITIPQAKREEGTIPAPAAKPEIEEEGEPDNGGKPSSPSATASPRSAETSRPAPKESGKERFAKRLIG